MLHIGAAEVAEGESQPVTSENVLLAVSQYGL